MDLGLKNKVALVFASSKGIGKAIAESLASEGCKLTICSRNKENLLNTAKMIQGQYNAEVNWQICDLYNPENIKSVVNNTIDNFGSVDILVNNCGGPPALNFREISNEQWNNSFREIFLSTVLSINLVIDKMKENKFGRIINITSLTVKQPADNLIISNSLSTAVTSYSKTLSNQVGMHNITVNTVAPGYTLTSRLYDLANDVAKKRNSTYEDVLSEYSKNVPMQRLGRPDEIGNLVAFLASEKSGYITGQTILVDGGMVKGLF